jgi:hypothetical protein
MNGRHGSRGWRLFGDGTDDPRDGLLSAIAIGVGQRISFAHGDPDHAMSLLR